MLVGAMDVSGRVEKGNYMFMGIVLGTKENLDIMINNLQLNELSVHTAKQNRIRNDLISKIKFNGKENIGFCIRLDKDKIVDDVKKKVDSSRYGAIYRRYNHLLFQFMRESISDFLVKHKTELSEISFQCDADCQGFITDNNLCSCEQESVHVLADLVAWSNNKEKTLDGVIDLDSRNWIKKELKGF